MTCNPCIGMGKSSFALDSLGNNCEPTGLVFTPELIFFGDITVSEYDFTPAQFVVRNSGKGDIHILDVRVVVGAETFSLVSAAYPSLLRGGEEFLLQIKATIPSEMGDHVGVLEIVTDEVRINYSVGIHARFSDNDNIQDQIEHTVTDKVTLVRTEVTKYVDDTRDALNSSIIAKYNDAIAKVTEESWVRASADEAEAGHRLTLEAKLGEEITSKIVQEQIARATQYEAFATSTENLLVKYKDDTDGAIEIERTVRATAISAEATTREALAVTLRGDMDTKVSAGIAAERTVRVTAEEAIASSVETLGTTLTSYTNDTVSAAITAERTVRVTAEAAIAQSVEDLRADFQSGDGADTAYVDAQITAVKKAYADADQAVAQSFDTLLASYVTNSSADAKVASEASARALQDGALSTRIDTVEAKFAGGGDVDTRIAAKVSEEATARANAIQAESTSIRGVFASYATSDALTNAINAEVTNRNTAITNATSGFAESINTVKATADGAKSDASAAVTTASSAQTTANTALAKYSFKLDANGYVGGMEANNNGQRVDIIFNSDLIQFRKPGGGAGLNMSGGELWATDPLNRKRARFGYWG